MGISLETPKNWAEFSLGEHYAPHDPRLTRHPRHLGRQVHTREACWRRRIHAAHRCGDSVKIQFSYGGDALDLPTCPSVARGRRTRWLHRVRGFGVLRITAEKLVPGGIILPFQCPRSTLAIPWILCCPTPTLRSDGSDFL